MIQLNNVSKKYVKQPVLHNISFTLPVGKIIGIVAKAEEIMTFMQLEPHMKIKNLSKGNRGRLKIMLTLAREVSYILMDAPLSGLDPMVRESIVKGMISYVDLEYQTLIMTSHEITEIESLLDSFIAIKDGSLLKIADVAEIHESEGLGITDWMKKNY
ncbi:hypothetical protein [Paenibacillus alginolyticus]|uniref:hypothetical protein n=1 Tax=Paenibacillus alginolyticus TaxID=59839 RepID=UPI001FE5A80E|nr:hypothetical protein [Paenibacillus frigoriresistens]